MKDMNMPALAIKRLLLSVPIMLGASLVIFLLVHASGDPLQNMRMTPGVSATEVQAIEHRLGLDRPLVEQYGSWAASFVTGDWGDSVSSHRPVRELILERLPATLELMLSALLISFALAVVIGGYQARRGGAGSDRLLSAGAYTFMSTPIFWLALLFQLLLGYMLSELTGIRFFYTAGQWTPGEEGNLLNGLQHLALPLLTLVVAQAAVWSRYHRASMRETMNAQYLRSARALGLPEKTIRRRYVLPAAITPLIAAAAADMPALFGGAVVTETIFAWPGMGSLFLRAVERSDYPLLMGLLMVTAVLVIIFNLVADLIGKLLDPRAEV